MNKAELERLSDDQLSELIRKIDEGIVFDINNWSDMGLLIDESDISIVKDGSYSWATNNPQELYEPMGDKSHEVQITNKVKTLRAAAIVWLLMQEGE